jgi:hypothetical protein
MLPDGTPLIDDENLVHPTKQSEPINRTSKFKKAAILGITEDTKPLPDPPNSCCSEWGSVIDNWQ